MAEDGALGWLGQRWLPQMLLQLPETPQEAQLKSAARVTARLRFEKGRIEGEVPLGTTGRDAAVTLRVKPLGDREWRKVIEWVGARRESALRLLSGQFGPDLEEAFTGAGAGLFPAPTLKCSCRSDELCRHQLALLITATVQLDSNPYLWLEVLGRPRAGLQAAVQARLSETAAPDPDEVTPEHFWETEADLSTITVRPGVATDPGALLRSLGPLPLPSEQAWVELEIDRVTPRGPAIAREARPVHDALRSYVRYIGEAGAALANGDLPPRFVSEPLPGKAVPPATRLPDEIAIAVRQEGTALTLTQLARTCPTAAALPGKLGRAALLDALPYLPDDLVALARRYVAPRQALLAGATFRHVVTFDDWRRGRLSPGADWALALRSLGLEPQPVRHEAEVGDELWLTLTGGAVHVERVPRRTRRPGLDPGARKAAATLLTHLGETGQWGMAEQEAVAVLLAEGHYGQRPDQDPAWLLPYQVQGITTDRGGRWLTREQTPWRPPFDRPRTGLHVLHDDPGVTWWLEHWPTAHEKPGSAPPLGALLEFLWLFIPLQAPRRGLAPGRVAAGLARWFRELMARYAGLDNLYSAHVDACELTDALAFRIATLPESGAPDSEHLAWRVEGYRWIGAERCWPVLE